MILSNFRKPIVSLIIGSSLVSSVVFYEGFTEKAVIPIKNDKVTYGSGFTTREDGSPVRMGDTITRKQSDLRLVKELQKYGDAVKRCAPVDMFQYEYDAFVSFTYNLGTGTFCKSNIPKYLIEHDYASACREILKYNKQCTINEETKVKTCKVIKGLDNRRKDEYKTCMGAQEQKENK